MKIRNGFVSNSSLSSFVIELSALEEWQIFAIIHHIKIAKLMIECKKNALDYYEVEYEPEEMFPVDLGYFDESDEWNIAIDKEKISGFTSMDNFDMQSYFRYLGINKAIFEE